MVCARQQGSYEKRKNASGPSLSSPSFETLKRRRCDREGSEVKIWLRKKDSDWAAVVIHENRHVWSIHQPACQQLQTNSHQSIIKTITATIIIEDAVAMINASPEKHARVHRILPLTSGVALSIILATVCEHRKKENIGEGSRG